MATTSSRRYMKATGLVVLGLVSLSSQAVAQVHRGGSVSGGHAARPTVSTPHDLAHLTDAMRSHNARLRLLLAERDRELKAVKSELRQAQEHQESLDSGGIYPLFIATP